MTTAADDSTELEAFRQRRQMELQQQLDQQAKQQAAAEAESHVQAQEQQALDQAMKTILTSEARGRLTNISLVDPNKADLMKRQLVSLHEQQKISIPVNDEQLKRILASLSKSRRDASIRRM
ncbi:MAG: DNA-binding protein [Candidatus Thermoplasmatota archaeon]|nr:DNA-binding protein [Candidatus Thermoplasmatota archaeon]